MMVSVQDVIAEMLTRTNKDRHPQINALSMLLRDLPVLALNTKFFGYELARALASNLPIRTMTEEPPRIDLGWRACTQSDLESYWAAFWLAELKSPVLFHRKLWEFAYVMQAIHENGLLKKSSRGLGFGCGEEPLPSYFASHGVEVTVTDLKPEEQASTGWAATGQHTSTVDKAYKKDLVSRENFDANVSLRYVDMNSIPNDLLDFDFCWSICALEHLGSIENGLKFVENAMATLKPGGVAIHTTEFNFLDDMETVDNWPTVLFQKKHFSELADRLRRAGHHVANINFDVGSKPMDRFIDVPPYQHDWKEAMKSLAGSSAAPHLKLSIDGFASTCYGMIIKRGLG